MVDTLQKLRKHALACETLAERSNSTSERQHQLNLAQTWHRIAANLEGTRILLKAINGFEVKVPQAESGIETWDRPAHSADRATCYNSVGWVR